jgi:hypothetical protein
MPLTAADEARIVAARARLAEAGYPADDLSDEDLHRGIVLVDGERLPRFRVIRVDVWHRDRDDPVPFADWDATTEPDEIDVTIRGTIAPYRTGAGRPVSLLAVGGGWECHLPVCRRGTMIPILRADPPYRPRYDYEVRFWASGPDLDGATIRKDAAIP